MSFVLDSLFLSENRGRFVQYLTPESEDKLRQIAQAIVANEKGILAADESVGEY